jgi:hypothetical protein
MTTLDGVLFQPGATAAEGGDAERCSADDKRGEEERLQAAVQLSRPAIFSSLTWPATIHDAVQVARTQIRSAIKLSADVAQVLVGDGSEGAREVRISFTHKALPGTSVRVREFDGQLDVELIATDEETCAWLTQNLAEFTLGLGMNLARRVRVAVHIEGQKAPVDTAGWPRVER